MLSGKAPFYSKIKTDSASSIMRRIKEGDFRLEGESWRFVSTAAKQLTKGLLTVDPRKRFSLEQVRSSSWVTGVGPPHTSSPALLTSRLLLAEPTERCLKQTYDAFHNATREGFRLTPVSSASSKLLHKRKLKQSVSSDTCSSVSDRSSLGSKSSGSSGVTVTSSKHWPDAVHPAPPLPAKKDMEIFSFKSGQVQQYLQHQSGFPQPSTVPHPYSLPLSVQVGPAPPTVSSHRFISSPHSLLPAYPPSYTFSDSITAVSGVSLSLIQSDLDVINSSSVIPKVSAGGGAAVSAASSANLGPLTRSRKRKLCQTESRNGDKSEVAAKTKVARTGTIVIE